MGYSLGKAKRAFFGAFVAFASMAAAPAQAEAEDNALIPETRTTAPGVALQGNDTQFKELFASWEGLEQKAPSASGVSIPSSNPLQRGYMSSGYGNRTHPVLGGRRKHNGVDIAAPTGTPIYATADGMVSRAGWFSSYGKYIAIEHGANMQTRFAHLSRIAVADGERVRKGDLIGYVGSTGRSTGPHLHYEVRIGGKSVDPTQYMDETNARNAFAQATGQGGMGGAD